MVETFSEICNLYRFNKKNSLEDQEALGFITELSLIRGWYYMPNSDPKKADVKVPFFWNGRDSFELFLEKLAELLVKEPIKCHALSNTIQGLRELVLASISKEELYKSISDEKVPIFRNHFLESPILGVSFAKYTYRQKVVVLCESIFNNFTPWMFLEKENAEKTLVDHFHLMIGDFKKHCFAQHLEIVSERGTLEEKREKLKVLSEEFLLSKAGSCWNELWSTSFGFYFEKFKDTFFPIPIEKQEFKFYSTRFATLFKEFVKLSVQLSSTVSNAKFIVKMSRGDPKYLNSKEFTEIDKDNKAEHAKLLEASL